jgi:hypothetical protein
VTGHQLSEAWALNGLLADQQLDQLIHEHPPWGQQGNGFSQSLAGQILHLGIDTPAGLL